MLKIPVYKQLLSYLYPVRIRRSSSAQNPLLELYLFKNEFQLATKDALYSDGRRYRPLVDAFNALERKIDKVGTVLILGAGLGSGVQILANRGLYPHCTLVDHDATILSWIEELLQDTQGIKIETVCADAKEFVLGAQQKKYDLLIADIFNGRVVPDFVTSQEFLKACLSLINTGGHFVLNYIVQDANEWQKKLTGIHEVFPDSLVLSNDINRIIVATV